LALGNLQIRDGATSAAIDFYLGATSTDLYNAVGDLALSQTAAFVPKVGVWTHVREEISISENRMALILDGSADTTIAVTRDLSSIKPKSGFVLLGLSHYAGQGPTGRSSIRIDNVVVNAPAM
jgi:hypothetical protein